MHEFDKCIVAYVNGTKIGEGFVHEFDGTMMKVCLDGGLALKLRQEVTVFVFNRVMGECVYRGFVADVDEDNVAVDRLTFVKSTQKRDNTRAEVTLHYRIMHCFAGGGTKKRRELEKPEDITVLNISARGMLMSSGADFPKGYRFPFIFLEAGKPIEIDVEIVRSEKSRKGNRYGCRFLDVSEKDADNIYRYVLHEQIEQRRRSLLI